MMKFEVERARDWFRQGLPLIGKVDSELAIDLDLFSRGGQEILNAIEKQRLRRSRKSSLHLEAPQTGPGRARRIGKLLGKRRKLEANR